MNPSKEQSDWVHNVCVTYISHICSRRYEQISFSGDNFSSALRGSSLAGS